MTLRKAILAAFLLPLLMILSAVAHAQTQFYVSPSGNDANNGLSISTPWQHFSHAIPLLNPGSTLNLLDGTYTASTTGLFSANCSSGAQNGTSSALITVQALNERQAFISGQGATAFLLQNCSFWKVYGLHAESADLNSGSSFSGYAMQFVNVQHSIIQRNIAARNNRFHNVHTLSLEGASSNNQVIENEVYYFHRVGILLFGGSNFNEVRQNYANNRGYDNISGGYPNGGTIFSISSYTSNNNLLENNIEERTTSGPSAIVGLNLEDSASNNSILGNMSGVGLTYGTRIDPHTGQPQSTGNTFVNSVSVLPASIGFWARSTKASFDHDTVIGNASTSLAGFQSDTDSGAPYPSYSFAVNNSTVQKASAATGYKSVNVTGTCDHDNNFGNGATYSGCTATNANTADPGFGACYLWAPLISPLQGAGSSGTVIGATIVNQYSGGILTTSPLWNASTGAPLFAGAVVVGLNSDPTQSLIGIQNRLNINQNGCAFPLAVQVTPSTVTLSSGGAQQFTANQTVTWTTTAGTISSSGFFSAPTVSSPTTVTISATSSNGVGHATVTVNPASSSANYYVSTSGSDANNGTSPGTSWKTLAHADAAMTVPSAGAIVNVAAGTYPQGAAELQLSKSGTSSSAFVLYQCATVRGCIITSTLTGNNAIVDVFANFLKMDGFVLTDVNAAIPNVNLGFFVRGHDVQFTRGTVHDLQPTCNSNGGGGLVLFSGSGSNNVFDSDLVYNIGNLNSACNLANTVHGINMETNGPATGRATNNIVHHVNGGWCIQSTMTALNNVGSVFANNLLFACGNGGIVFAQQGTGIIDFNTVINNSVLDNGTLQAKNGIYEFSTTGTHNKYANNNVFGNAGANYSFKTGSQTGGISVDPSLNTTFVNWQINGSGDYHLKAGSPAISAGISTCASGTAVCVPPTDFDGVVRPTSGAQSIGPYVFVNTGVPVVTFTPSPLAFGTIPVSTSSTLVATLKNTGGSNLTFSAATITGTNSSVFKIASTTCVSPLGASLSCTYNVTATPSAAGLQTANLTLNDNASGSPHQLPLTVTGGTVGITINPTSLTFGVVAPGSCSTVQTDTITSSGTSPLVIQSTFTFSNPVFQFGGSGTCSVGQSLNPGQSCTASVKFCPTTPGAATGTLSISTNAPSSPTLLPLSGTGGSAVLSLAPTSANCGTLQVGTSAACQSFTLTNTGTIATTTITASISGGSAASFSQTNNCTTLASAGTCTINVVMQPTTAGALSANLQASASNTNTATSSLSGAGSAASLTLTPTTANFGNVLIGTTSSATTITAKNTGIGPVTITSITTAIPFARTNVNCPISPATLAAGASCTFTVTATPTGLGAANGSVTVVDSAVGSPHNAALTVTGVAPIASLTPSSFNYGNQPVGTQGSSHDFVLANTGTGLMTITSIGVTGDYLITTNTCGTNVAAGLNCVISIAFKPTAAGTRAGILSVVDSAAGSPHQSSLTGNGTSLTVLITPSSLTYASRTVGTTSPPQTASLQNTGNTTLNLTSVGVTGDYAISSNTCGSTVAAGVTCAIGVTFTPTATGTRTGTLTFTDNANGSPQQVPITGTGTAVTAPIATITPGSLSFGNQVINTTSSTLDFTLQNTGTAILNITSIVANGNFARTTTCGSTLAISASCLVHVSFTPTALGPRSGTVVFTDDAAGSPQSFPVTGVGVSAPAPTADITPGSLTFSSQTVNTTSAPQTLTLTNNGNATLNITSIVSTGDYGITANACGSTLAAGANCTLGVTFTPTATGTRTGTIKYTDDATGSPQTISLTGTGIAPTAPIASLSVSALAFGSQVVGGTTAAMTVTLTNTGNAVLNITSILPTGDFHISANTCGGTLGISASCVVSVTFTPTAVGARTGFLNFTDDATGSPQQVSLSGNGTAPTAPIATINPTTLNFGNVVISTPSSTLPVTLQNTGNAIMNISSIAASGDFSVASTTCGLTLAISATCTVNARFTPTALGPRTGLLSFTDDAAGSPQTVSLNGAGVPAPEPIVSLSTASLTFPNTIVGFTSSALDVTLTNTGNATLNIASIVASSEFARTTTCGSTVAAGASCVIHVTFSPSAPGARVGTLSITDDAAGSPQQVTLSGTGISGSPALCINPLSINFNSQPVGTSSNPTPISVTNCGTASAIISAVTPSTNFLQSNNCTTLLVGATCTIQAVFHPLSAGTLSGTFSIVSNAASSPDVVNATGFGTQTGAAINPTSISFGHIVVGQQSIAATLTVTNQGNQSISVNAPTIVGANPTDFSFGGTCGAPPGLSDSFNTGVLDPTKWVIDTGNIGNQSLGTASTGSAANVSMANSALGLKLTQVTAGNSVGAEVRSINTFGYGTYQWTARTSSTATTPGGAGTAVSGQVTGLFNYFQNSGLTSPFFTENDFEVEGQHPTQLEMTSWSSASPVVNTETNFTAAGMDTAQHVYKFVWAPGRIDYYFDGTLVSTHLTNVPSNPAFILMNHWGTNSASFGGTASVGVTRWAYITGFTFTPAGAGSLAPGGSCVYNVFFNPTTTGSRSATFQQTFGGGVPTVSATLSGTGDPALPLVSFTPTSVDFGDVTQGTPSRTISVQINNPGNATLNITGSPTLTGTNASDYLIVNNHCGSTIIAGGLCIVDLSVTPQGLGARTANLHLVDDAADSPQNLPLTVNGVAAPTPSATFNPSTTIAFGNVKTGGTSALVETVGNIGDASLHVSSVALGGANPSQYSQTNNCSTVIPGGSCAVTVNCSPTTVGSKPATLVIGSDDPVTPSKTINLTCTGRGHPHAVVGVTSINFGNTTVGTTSTALSFTVTNTGDDTLNVSDISTTGDTFPQNNTCTCCPVAPNTACSVQVQFSPQNLCGQFDSSQNCISNVHLGSLAIVSDADNGTQTVALAGTAVPVPPPPGPIIITVGGKLHLGGHLQIGVQ